jgi:DNA replication protein DnaC
MKEPEKIGVITRREYEWLKTFKTLEPHEEKKVKEFEEVNNKPIQVVKEEKPKKEIKKITITKGLLWKNFLIFFKAETGQDFQQTKDSIENIAPIINFFALDDNFFRSNRLVKKYNEPSFDKGLLVIGMFGNGKTTIFKVLSKMFKHFNMPMRFKAVNAHDLVTEWETLDSPGDKYLFFEKYLCRSLYIDDVKKEKTASNYGKSEVIKEILEKRYDLKLRTYITCNYRESDSVGDLNDALMEFNRYGNHIYDRLFEMFNIIEFKGKTFRK